MVRRKMTSFAIRLRALTALVAAAATASLCACGPEPTVLSLRDAAAVFGINFYDHGRDVVTTADETTTATSTTSTSQESAEEMNSGEDSLPSGQLANSCADAPLLGAGNWTAIFSGTQPDTGLDCGGDGEPRFFRFQMAQAGALRVAPDHPTNRVRVALWTGGCAQEQPLACSNLPGAAVELPFVAAGEVVYGALLLAGEETTGNSGDNSGGNSGDSSGDNSADVEDSSATTGASNSDAATSEQSASQSSAGDTSQDASASGSDTSDELPDERIASVAVLARYFAQLGAVCDVASPLIACPPGSRCLADANGGEATCQTLTGDLCLQASVLPISQSTTLSVVTSTNYHDAHFHGCGGAGMRERVWQLELSPSLLDRLPADGGHLVLETHDSDLVLAIRAPSCQAEDEQACAVATLGVGAQIVWPSGDATLRDEISRGTSPYLFVDWSDPPDNVSKPLNVRISVL